MNLLKWVIATFLPTSVDRPVPPMPIFSNSNCCGTSFELEEDEDEDESIKKATEALPVLLLLLLASQANETPITINW